MKILVSVLFFVAFSAAISFSPVYAQDTSSGNKTVSVKDLLDRIKTTGRSTKKKGSENNAKTMSPEQAKALVFSKSTAKDAVSGTVSEDSGMKYYDIRARQMAYRENAKDLRASLEARRVNFEAPRLQTIEDFRETQPKVYEAESAAYQKSLKDGPKKKTMMKNVKTPSEKADVPKKDGVSDGGVKERDVPSSDEGVKKKVITSDDAPDFDPSNL